MRLREIREIGTFYKLRTKYLLLSELQSLVVAAYVYNQPRVATDSTWHNLLLERLALFERNLVFRRQSIRERYETIGKRITHADDSEQTNDTASDQESQQRSAADFSGDVDAVTEGVQSATEQQSDSVFADDR